MKKLSLLLMLVPAASFAENPFACVDPEIQQAFLPDYPTPFVYSTELPAGFVQHAVPDGASLIGSQASESHVTAIYKISGDVEVAIDQFALSFSHDEWLDIGDISAASRAGFQSRQIPRIRQFCHDEGPTLLSINSKGGGDSQLVALSVTGSPSVT